MSGAGVADTSPSRNPRGRSSLLDWRAVLGIAISVVLLWWTFRNEDLGKIAHEIAQADPLLFLLATVAATFVFWIRAWRWKALVDPVYPHTSFRSRFAAVSIGFMGNNLLPARIGEFARAYAFSRIEPVPLVASFSTLVMERLLDALFIVGALMVAMALPDFPGLGEAAWLVATAKSLAALIVLAFLILFALVIWPRRTVRAVEAVVERVLPGKLRRPIVDALEAFLRGAGVLRNGRLLVVSGIWTIVLWLVNTAGFWLAFEAFGLDLSFTAALFLNSAIALFVSVPSAPGFFGVYEAAARLVLIELWGGEPTRALAFAAGYHIAGFIPITLIGLYYIRQIGLSLGQVSRTEETVEEAVEQSAASDIEGAER